MTAPMRFFAGDGNQRPGNGQRGQDPEGPSRAPAHRAWLARHPLYLLCLREQGGTPVTAALEIQLAMPVISVLLPVRMLRRRLAEARDPP